MMRKKKMFAPGSGGGGDGLLTMSLRGGEMGTFFFSLSIFFYWRFINAAQCVNS